MREHLAEMAFEFCVAGVEFEIYHAISCKVADVTIADIHHCRSRYAGTIGTCIQRLQEKQNIHISHHHTKVHLTTTDCVEPLQVATDGEYLAKSMKVRHGDIRSSSTVNDGTEHCK